jgi:hypothetical protein
MSDFNFDFNDAGDQKTFDVIPDNTVCAVQLTIRPGGAGPDGWLTHAKDGNSDHVNCEFAVVDGAYAKRKVFARYTVAGINHAEAIEISRRMFKAMLQSARSIRPDDKSEAAKTALRTQGWADFDQLRFPVRIGVEPPKDGYAAKNTIREIITPERQAWKKVAPVDRSLIKQSAKSTAAAPHPANAITRPPWAGLEKN